MLVGSSLCLVLGLYCSASSVHAAALARRLRRHGTPISGEVVDVEATARSYYGGYLLRPIVRYRVGGQEHEVSVANLSGKLPLGSGMDLRVDPRDPYTVVCADQDNTPTAVAGTLFFLVLAVLLTWWAIVLL